MNVYEKLQNCRVRLQKESLKKSGQNKFAGYSYFELSDFLPTINELMLEFKLCSSIRFDNEMATLEIIDVEKPEDRITFTSPIAEAQLKGCHPVQNLGAIQTYIRRYLYTNAYELCEHDALDMTVGKPTEDKKPQEPQKFPSEIISASQVTLLYTTANSNADVIKNVCAKYGYNSSKTIKKSDFNKILKEVETEVNKAV